MNKLSLPLNPAGIDDQRMVEFWSAQEEDKALAWDLYVELTTRITVQELKDDEGNDLSALDSVFSLFPMSRKCMRQHGVSCANTGTLINCFLNQKLRWFTAKWHKQSIEDEWANDNNTIHPEFRSELRTKIQPMLKKLANSLSHLVDARLD